MISKAIFDDKVKELDREEKVEEFKEALLDELKNDPDGLSEYFYKMISENYPKIPQTFYLAEAKHYSDLEKQPQAQFLKDLYSAYSEGKSMDEAYSLAKRNCVANILADAVGKGTYLFGDGKNRGHDFEKLREHFQAILAQPELANKYMEFVNFDGENLPTLKTTPEVRLLIDSIATNFHERSSYTLKGAVVTGEIYLQDSIFKTDQLIAGHYDMVKDAVGEKKIMYEKADIIGQKIGEQLFGSSMSDSRQKETEVIKMHLAKEVLPELLKSNPHLLDNLTEEKMTEMVGEIKYGMTGVSSKTGLCAHYYDNVTSYTKTGALLSGGIQLNESKLKTATDSICDSISAAIEAVLGKTKYQDLVTNGRETGTVGKTR